MYFRGIIFDMAALFADHADIIRSISPREKSFALVPRYLGPMHNPVIVAIVRLLDPKLVSKRARYAGVGLGSS